MTAPAQISEETAAAKKAAAALLAGFGNLATAFLGSAEDDLTPLFADAVLKARDHHAEDITMKPTCHSRCREILPADIQGHAKPWTHVATRGEFPGVIDIPAGYDVPGYGITEKDMSVEGLTVFDDATMESMVQRFQDDVLIDYEHFSHDKDKHTEAAGWGIELRYSADRKDLELQTDWAKPAREKISDQVYRYISPEFIGAVSYDGGKFKFRPTSLTGAGLTNRPKLKALRPVSANRSNHNETETDTTMSAPKSLILLCSLLGVPATTAEAELETKVTAFRDEFAISKNRAAAADKFEAEVKELRAQSVNRDLEAYADVIGEDKESAKELLQTNRDAAVKFFDRARANAPAGNGSQAPLYQKNRATPPNGETFTAAEDDKKAGERNAFVATVRNRDKSTFESAWASAKAEKPELF